MRSKHLAFALLASSLPFCAAAQQTEYATVVATPDVPAKTVDYGDLNLQRHEGITVLYRRIQVAASAVCLEPNARAPQVAARIRACASEATTRAVAQVGVPALVALHAKQSTEGSKSLVVAGGSR
jgi:UrcA family protein